MLTAVALALARRRYENRLAVAAILGRALSWDELRPQDKQTWLAEAYPDAEAALSALGHHHMSVLTKVVGSCPMGCGATLFLGAGGHVTCSFIGCPDPSAVDKILDEGETEHVVVFYERNFTIQHPLRERVDGLFDCGLHRYCRDLPGPPAQLGRYRVRIAHGGAWTFELLQAAE
jgi:hypothetical protein